MEKKMFAFASILAGFFCFVVFSSFNEHKATNETSPIETSKGLQQHISSFSLNKEFAFAEEPIPTGNFDALERLDRELVTNSYLHAGILLSIKMANRYFPIIEPILKEYGIPEDFKYLAVAESNLRMATSSAGAKGVWQFMEPTGEAYGLQIDDQVDERYHIEKSTQAACKFILHLKKKFGSWTLAAAAYNMGENGVARRLTEQYAENYYDLNLNEETSRYVFRIIAIKEIMKDPEHFGFFVEQDQMYPPMDDYYTNHIDGPIPSLATFADQHGTSYRLFKVYNPWLIGSSLTNKAGKRYEIRIPKK